MKKVVIAVLVVFLGFWLFTDPNGLAATSKTAGTGAWTATESMFRAVIDFVGAL
jgi:hypothetical protein